MAEDICRQRERVKKVEKDMVEKENTTKQTRGDKNPTAPHH